MELSDIVSKDQAHYFFRYRYGKKKISNDEGE